MLGTSGSGASKATGGSNSKTIAQANLPAVKIQLNSFSLSRGTMEITGKLGIETSDNISGAFYKSGGGTNLESGWGWRTTTQFQASRAWTGTTNTAQPQTVNLGSGQALDITPAYYTVHMWLRLT